MNIFDNISKTVMGLPMPVLLVALGLVMWFIYWLASSSTSGLVDIEKKVEDLRKKKEKAAKKAKKKVEDAKEKLDKVERDAEFTDDYLQGIAKYKEETAGVTDEDIKKLFEKNKKKVT